MPIEEMIGAVLAKIKASGNRAMYFCLGGPARGITAWQGFHRRDGITIGRDISINFWRAKSKAATDRPILDFLEYFVAGTHRAHQKRHTDEPETLNKDTTADTV